MNERKLKEKLSGRFRFPNDVNSKWMMYIAVISSQERYGRIDEIVFPEMPSGYSYITADDIPGENTISINNGKIPLLADKKVTYKGEPAALICGPDLKRVEFFKSKTYINITKEEPLPKFELNNRSDHEYSRKVMKGDPDKFLNSDKYTIVEDLFETSSQNHFTYPLPHSSCQKEGNRYIIHSITQAPWILKRNISSILNMKLDSIKIREYPCENNQDSNLVFPVHTGALAALASYICKGTVSYQVNLNDSFYLSSGRGQTIVKMKGAADNNGLIKSLKVDFAINSGASGFLCKEIIDRSCFSAAGSYKIPNLYIKGRNILTNEPPAGIFADYGTSPVNTAVELLISRISEKSGFDKIEIRKKNLIDKKSTFISGESPFRESSLNELIEKVIKRSDFARKDEAYSYQNRSLVDKTDILTNLNGIGISLGFLGNDFIDKSKDLKGSWVTAELTTSGELIITIPAYPSHNKLIKYWMYTVSKTLKMDINNIKITEPDIASKILCAPSSAGRNVTVIDKLIQLSIQEINKKRFRDPLPIRVTKKHKRRSHQWNDEFFEGIPFQYFSWGAVVTELEIDSETNRVFIKKIWSVLDCGNIIIPSLADSIVERGVREVQEWFKLYGNSDNFLIPGFKDRLQIDNEFIEKGNSPKPIDGLIQKILPGSILQALRQASGKDHYSIPFELNRLDFS